MSDDIHSCSYYCDRPACVKEQRDKMRDAMAIDDVKMPDTFVWEIRYPFGDFETVKYHGTNALADYRDHVHPDAYVRELVYKKDAIEYADAKCAELEAYIKRIEAGSKGHFTQAMHNGQRALLAEEERDELRRRVAELESEEYECRDQERIWADAEMRARIAELEQSADLHYKSHAAAIAKLAESEKRVAELEADARRYRWLRDVHEHNIFVTRHVGAPTISRCFGEYLDSLIDKVFAIGAEGGE